MIKNKINRKTTLILLQNNSSTHLTLKTKRLVIQNTQTPSMT